MSLPEVVDKVLRWLRAGYPDGIPATDYFPLFALLSTRLSEEEIEDFTAELAGLTDADTAKVIYEAAAGSTSRHPSADQLARVRARLEAGREQSGDAEMP
jgi:Protein of unknown function (DUF3349)